MRHKVAASVEDENLKATREMTASLKDKNSIGDAVSLDEITAHFWPEDNTSASEDASQTVQAVRFEESSRTLHASAAEPNKLAYLILFQGANPRWDSDGIIFTKSRLDLLPTASTDSKPPDSTTPIAVFKQKGTRTGRGFEFDGWFKIKRLTFLEPKSPELVKMLEQKWQTAKGNHRERNPAGWETSLNLKWAVIKLVKDQTALQERGAPRIGRLPDKEEKPKETVNEMLAEMRDSGS